MYLGYFMRFYLFPLVGNFIDRIGEIEDFITGSTVAYMGHVGRSGSSIYRHIYYYAYY